jgi:hypothetical protein
MTDLTVEREEAPLQREADAEIDHHTHRTHRTHRTTRARTRSMVERKTMSRR